MHNVPANWIEIQTYIYTQQHDPAGESKMDWREYGLERMRWTGLEKVRWTGESIKDGLERVLKLEWRE